MIDFEMGTRQMDIPEVLNRLFYPRREFLNDSTLPAAKNHYIQVEDKIKIVCRFYPSVQDGPNILFFHGNGETVFDYDYIAPLYQKRKINLFVADYRGYGASDGEPTCTDIIKDSHPIFMGFKSILEKQGYMGRLFVMGRSLGSAPAIEVAYHYQKELSGLIVESGFAIAKNQLIRLGVHHLFKDIPHPIGFGNDIKIKDITIPTLIIHGEEDFIIPVTEGKTLYDLSGATKKQGLFIPDAGHNDLLILGMMEYMKAIEEFTH
ncbi:MAG: lysophospholipase [Syntrophorhabdaceae bacterium]|nr:lysophospholipase [Syntrophorhabdaceae bacterium]